jgi:hypothetical protein
MIDHAVLIRRALRWVLDEHNLTAEALRLMDHATQQQLQDLAMSIADDMQYNQLRYFRPFEHQRRFFTTTTDRRGILAANRIGKTVSTCYETALHLTGLYPDWWTGKRFDKPITAMVAGESWGQVALVLQAELLGASDVKIRQQLGTGAIPRDCTKWTPCVQMVPMPWVLKYATHQEPTHTCCLPTTLKKLDKCRVSNLTLLCLTNNHPTISFQK